MIALFDEANAVPLLLGAEQTALLQAGKLILLSEQIAKNVVSDPSISFRYYHSLTNAIFYYTNEERNILPQRSLREVFQFSHTLVLIQREQVLSPNWSKHLGTCPKIVPGTSKEQRLRRSRTRTYLSFVEYIFFKNLDITLGINLMEPTVICKLLLRYIRLK